MLRPSVVYTVSVVAKRCVLQQKLHLSLDSCLCKESIGTKMNGLDLCLEVVLRSCQPFIASHSPLDISEAV